MTFISFFLIAAGIFFFTTATIGILRFPDCYTRMHAAGKGDTLGALLLLTGLALYNLHDGFSLAAVFVSLKILFIGIFIFIANPTAGHAIVKAALDADVKPWTGKEGTE